MGVVSSAPGNRCGDALDASHAARPFQHPPHRTSLDGPFPSGITQQSATATATAGLFSFRPASPALSCPGLLPLARQQQTNGVLDGGWMRPVWALVRARRRDKRKLAMLRLDGRPAAKASLFVLASVGRTGPGPVISRQASTRWRDAGRLRLPGATRQSARVMVWCGYGVRSMKSTVFLFSISHRYYYISFIQFKTAIRCPCYCRFAREYYPRYY